MTQSEAIRPHLTPRPYAWKYRDRSETPGIALWGKNGLTAHLTPPEARTLADRLHDLADDFQALESNATEVSR